MSDFSAGDVLPFVLLLAYHRALQRRQDAHHERSDLNGADYLRYLSVVRDSIQAEPPSNGNVVVSS